MSRPKSKSLKLHKHEYPKKPPKPVIVEKTDSSEKAKLSRQRSLPTESKGLTSHERDAHIQPDNDKSRVDERKSDQSTTRSKAEEQPVIERRPSKPTLPPKPKTSPPTTNRHLPGTKVQQTSQTDSTTGHSGLEHRPSAGKRSPRTQSTSTFKLLQTCEKLQSEVAELQKANTSSTMAIEALQSEQSRTLPLLEQAMKQQEALLGEVEQLKKELSKMSRRYSSGGGGGGGAQPPVSRFSKEEERRREELSNLNCTQVRNETFLR